MQTDRKSIFLELKNSIVKSLLIELESIRVIVSEGQTGTVHFRNSGGV